MELALQRGRQAGQIKALEEAERLQQALFQIADLAGADLEMSEMLRHVHGVLGTLMYAENCYIVEYDDVRDQIRFLYFADQVDDFVADPSQSHDASEMPRSLTVALLRHGKPLSGPSRELLARVVEQEHDPQRGRRAWTGWACRCCAMAGYAAPSWCRAMSRRPAMARPSALLGFVAQHVQTAMDRRQAQVRLEQQVERRTLELQRANHSLQDEVAERRRAEQLQTALYNIAEMAMSADNLAQFYGQVHGVVRRLLDARNFYIALVNGAGNGLDFVYSVDEHNASRAPRPFSRGLTEYVVRNRRPLLASRQQIDALLASGEVRESGTRVRIAGWACRCCATTRWSARSWCRATRTAFSVHDQRLLTFVRRTSEPAGAPARPAAAAFGACRLEKRVEERTRELAEVNEKLLGQIGERLRAEQRLTHQAMHDALTGLPNRLHLLDRLQDALALAKREGGPVFAVLFLDLDRFKLVNDSIGHAAGDRMLVEVAKRIVSMAGTEDVVARLGGDEFGAAAVPQGLAQALDFGQRLLLALQESMWIAGRELFPSGSLGIALWNPRYRTGEELLRDADAAMYRAKRRARPLRDLRRRHARAGHAQPGSGSRPAPCDQQPRLRAVLPADRAPVRWRSGRHEALLRWQHERRGLLLPGRSWSWARKAA
jgi:diguanylate cyclase (GGDEF)-like protein